MTVFRSLVTSEFRTDNLLNFYRRVGDSPNDNSLYLMFGKNTSWSANEDLPSFTPPLPNDSKAGQAQVWQNALGFSKIPRTDLVPSIPRNDWESGEIYSTGSIVITNSISTNLPSIAPNGYPVFKCIKQPDDVGEGTCSISPETYNTKSLCLNNGGAWTSQAATALPEGSGSSIDGGDGYLWQYLYTIPASQISSNTSNDFIPVPTPEELELDPVQYGLQDVSSLDDQFRLIYEVKCTTLIFTDRLGSEILGRLGVSSETYRQISLIINPLLVKEFIVNPDVKAFEEFYLSEDIISEAGEMIYMENRQPITKTVGQAEELRIVMTF
ncbi:baseplate wedge subunit [Paraglaciecola Antarctic GD virus 1]|nr:baseplate wedge subunit [Paraglaciecola Antarctic GD virus 1]